MKKILFFCFLVLVSHVSQAGPLIKLDIWDQILKTNVDENGFVNYKAIRTNKGGDLYEHLSFIEVSEVRTMSESDKLAFWINAYNANLIQLVLARPALKKIDEDMGLFDKKFKVALLNISLNDIEYRMIRGDLEKGGPVEGFSVKEPDPRAVMALANGAVDGPKLLNRSYKGATIIQQLELAAQNFAKRPKHDQFDWTLNDIKNKK